MMKTLPFLFLVTSFLACTPYNNYQKPQDPSKSQTSAVQTTINAWQTTPDLPKAPASCIEDISDFQVNVRDKNYCLTTRGCPNRRPPAFICREDRVVVYHVDTEEFVLPCLVHETIHILENCSGRGWDRAHQDPLIWHDSAEHPTPESRCKSVEGKARHQLDLRTAMNCSD